MPGNVCDPFAESTVPIHRSDPFGQEFPFGLVLLVILTLYFQDQCSCRLSAEPDNPA